jgi:hypothetical protein
MHQPNIEEIELTRLEVLVLFLGCAYVFSRQSHFVEKCVGKSTYGISLM